MKACAILCHCGALQLSCATMHIAWYSGLLAHPYAAYGMFCRESDDVHSYALYQVKLSGDIRFTAKRYKKPYSTSSDARAQHLSPQP